MPIGSLNQVRSAGPFFAYLHARTMLGPVLTPSRGEYLSPLSREVASALGRRAKYPNSYTERLKRRNFA